MKAHIAQCESNCFSAHTNKTDVVGVRGRCASCTGLNQLFKQLRANDVITNTDLQALSAPSAATALIFTSIHLTGFVVQDILTVYYAHSVCTYTCLCTFLVFFHSLFHCICCVSHVSAAINQVNRSTSCTQIVACKTLNVNG